MSTPSGKKNAHDYKARLVWDGNLGEGTSTYTGYGRKYRVQFDGKPDLTGSADPIFRGDANIYNPEDLFVASLSSCHLLSYLALCARSKINVIAYEDDAIGTMVLLFGILAIAANAETLSKPGDLDLSFVFSRGLQPLLVGVLILGIGLSLGGELALAEGLCVRHAATGELAKHWPEAQALLPPEFGRDTDRLCVVELQRELAAGEVVPDAAGEIGDAVDR